MTSISYPAKAFPARTIPFLFCIFWLFAVCMPKLATAADRIVERAYFEDKESQLSFEQARQRAFTPYTGLLSRGYSQSAFWLRLRIAPAGAEKLVLRIRPTYLDEIALFDPLQPSVRPRLAGDRQPWEKSEYPSLNFNFVVPMGDAPRDIWLRLKTTSTNQIYVEALPLAEIQKSDSKLDLLDSIYLASLVLFLVWALIHWFTQRERVIGVFIAKQAIALVYGLFYLGYFRVFLGDSVPAPWLDKATSLLIVGYVAAAIWFDSHLLREFQPPKWGMRLLRVLLALFPLEIALMILGKTTLALNINMIAILIEPLLAWLLAIMAGAWKTGENGTPPLVSRSALILLYSTVMVSVSLASLPTLGLVNTSEFTLYNFLGYGLISGVAMVAVLQLRVRRMEQRRMQVLTQFAVIEKQVEQERRQRLEQGKFMAMLAHELKTPLSVMRMVLGSKSPSGELLAHADRAVRDMDAVIERCLHAEKLSDRQLTANLAGCRLSDELRELRHNSPAPERLVVNSEISPVLKTDAQMLRIILANLIDNAMKYSPPGSPVQIDVAQENKARGDGIAISVKNLPGVAGRPDPEKVFQKYYRGKAAHHQTGSGLGLFLAESMARLLGGEVGYAPGDSFIRFKLWLPA